jgi:hypothetical protein
MPEEIINHGVIEGRKDTDYVAGVLPYFVRLTSGEWDPFAPSGVKQWNAKADDMSCVSHSDIESIQTQEKFLTGSAPKYSVRWIAKMSGTTKEGNRLDTVVDTVRKYGLVLESSYPTPAEPWTFEEYHADIPEPLLSKLKAEGQEWLKKWAVSYEWVDVSGIYFKNFANIQKQLRQAPLQIIIPGHAILEIRNMTDVMRYLDTYDPFIKDRPQNQITNALKILLTPLKGQRMSNAILVKRGQGYGFYLEDINPSALISSGLHFGIDIPKNPDGSVNFAEVDKLVQGEVVTK